MDLPDLPSAASAVRVLCGAFFLPHTYAKLRHLPNAADFFGKIGLRPPKFFALLTATMEAIAASSLIFDVYRQIGAVIAATILFVAVWAQAKLNGLHWRWQFKGAEYMVFWGVVCLCVGWL